MEDTAALEDKPRSRKRNGLSKYDLIKVKVWLGDNMDHHYVLSRFLISRTLTMTRIPYVKAVKIALDVKKYLVDNNLPDIRQEQLEELLFRMMRGRGYDDKYIHCYRMVTKFMQQRRPLVILVGGSACTGKSTIAQQLASRLNLPNVMQTDITYELLRSGGVLPGRPLWEAGGLSPEQFLEEFRRQSLVVRKGLDGDFNKAIADGKPLIVEGLHLDPALYLEEFGRIGVVMMPGAPEKEGRGDRGPAGGAPLQGTASQVLTQRLSIRFDPSLLSMPPVTPPPRSSVLLVGRCRSFDERALQRLREAVSRGSSTPGRAASPTSEGGMQRGAANGGARDAAGGAAGGAGAARQGSRFGQMAGAQPLERRSVGYPVQDDDAVSDRSTTQSHANSPSRPARTSSTSSPFPQDTPTPDHAPSYSPPPPPHPTNPRPPFIDSLSTSLAKLAVASSAPVPPLSFKSLPVLPIQPPSNPPSSTAFSSLQPFNSTTPNRQNPYPQPPPPASTLPSPFFPGPLTHHHNHHHSHHHHDPQLPPILESAPPSAGISPVGSLQASRQLPFIDPSLPTHPPQHPAAGPSHPPPAPASPPSSSPGPPPATTSGSRIPPAATTTTSPPQPSAPRASPFATASTSATSNGTLYPPTNPPHPPNLTIPLSTPKPVDAPTASSELAFSPPRSPHPLTLPPPPPSTHLPPAPLSDPLDPDSAHGPSLATPFADPPACISSVLADLKSPTPASDATPTTTPPSSSLPATPRPLFVPIILHMAHGDHRLIAEEKLLHSFTPTSPNAHTTPPADAAADALDAETDAAAMLEQRLGRMELMQDYLCAFEAVGIPVVDVHYGNFSAALEELHEYVLKCIETVMEPAA